MLSAAPQKYTVLHRAQDCSGTRRCLFGQFFHEHDGWVSMGFVVPLSIASSGDGDGLLQFIGFGFDRRSKSGLFQDNDAFVKAGFKLSSRTSGITHWYVCAAAQAVYSGAI